MYLASIVVRNLCARWNFSVQGCLTTEIPPVSEMAQLGVGNFPRFPPLYLRTFPPPSWHLLWLPHSQGHPLHINGTEWVQIPFGAGSLWCLAADPDLLEVVPRGGQALENGIPVIPRWGDWEVVGWWMVIGGHFGDETALWWGVAPGAPPPRGPPALVARWRYPRFRDRVRGPEYNPY